MGEISKFPKSWNLENQNIKLAVCLQNIKHSKLNAKIPLNKLKLNQKIYYYMQNSAFCDWLSIMESLWKVSLKILNSGIILKIFTHALIPGAFIRSAIICPFIILKLSSKGCFYLATCMGGKNRIGDRHWQHSLTVFLVFCRSWSGYKLIAKIVSRQQIHR